MYRKKTKRVAVLLQRHTEMRHRWFSDSIGSRSGLSLLEVLLALSILGIATAILAQILQIGSDNGLRARRITQAQMLCESKMNEVVLGSATTTSVSWTPMTVGDPNAQWFYQIETISAEQPNLVGVVVSISDAEGVSSNARPLAKLVQWIVDPSLQMDTKTTTDASGTETDASGTSSGVSGGGT